jgi:hypothetical protein
MRVSWRLVCGAQRQSNRAQTSEPLPLGEDNRSVIYLGRASTVKKTCTRSTKEHSSVLLLGLLVGVKRVATGSIFDKPKRSRG